jgi:polyphosphate kinase 2
VQSAARKTKAHAGTTSGGTPRKRLVEQGDTAPTLTTTGVEAFVVQHAVDAAVRSKIEALQDIVSGLSAEESITILKGLVKQQTLLTGTPSPNPDEELSADWRTGGYPYKHLMLRRNYERQKYKLQVELLKLQAWVKETGAKVVILFEGRDAAGKGGTIKRFMEHLNPRGARVVALEKPTISEFGQWYFQRYVQHLPTNGEIVLFDRSWYNRAGVERVMGFCSDAEYLEFVRQCPEFERMLVRSGIHLIKFWFSVSRDEQRRRFRERKVHPAQTMETLAHRPRIARQMGRVYQGQRGDVFPHRHRRFAVDGHQIRLQEARAAQCDALCAAPPALREQRRGKDWRIRPAHRRASSRRLRTRRKAELSGARYSGCVEPTSGAALPSGGPMTWKRRWASRLDAWRVAISAATCTSLACGTEMESGGVEHAAP